MVTVEDYAGYNGWGVSPFSDVEALQKALTAGSGTDHATFANGRALIVESLEQTLMTTTFSARDVVLFKRLKTNPIMGVVDEWTQKSDYGQDYGFAVGETELPGARDSTYARKVGVAKFLRIQREVSHVMTLMKGLVDAEAAEQIDGTMLLLRGLEKTCFYGNSAIIPEEFDGLKTTLGASGNVINLRGPIDEATMQNACEIIRQGFGVPTDMFLSTANQKDVDRILENKHRVSIPMIQGANGGLVAGAPVTRYRTSFGDFDLNPDIFLTEERKPVPGGLVVAAAPAAPTTVTASAASTGSSFASTDAGTYFYGVSYFTKSGESAATALASAVTVASGQIVTLTMNGGTTGTVTGAKIFRSKMNAADATDMLQIDTVAFTGTGQTYADSNVNLPGGSDVYILNLDPMYDAISWQQLLPLMKLPLAITGPSIKFLIMLYGYLRITKPLHHCIIKNVRPSDHRFNP